MAEQVQQDLPKTEGPGFDPEVLVEKYREERSKRLRAEGVHQFRDAKGALQHYADDPYVLEVSHRQPVDEEHEVLIVGGGFGGILVAARLYEAGVKDFQIVEQGADFGGVWYWNRFPGAQCDTEAYIYLPLLEELGYIPTSKYVRDPEIRSYAQKVARHFELYPRTLFQTEMLSLKWNDENARWIGHTSRGDSIRSKFVITAVGTLHKPHLPGIPGIESYKGHSFHTSRWDYDYTGGDSNGFLTNLTDKRVAIIGTGASAVQSVPFLGKWAKELYVFQRTPSGVDLNVNKPTDHEAIKKMISQPGWQKRRMENFDTLICGGEQDEDLVGDQWTQAFQNIPSGTTVAKATTQAELEEIGKRIQMADFEAMERIRRRVDEVVKDPKTAAALKPWYNRMCKRPCFHNEYLPTFNLPNVHLVDTEGKGIERISEKGVVANGEGYDVDCIIYSTGFNFATYYSERGNLTIQGRNGLMLSEKFKSGPSTLHGLTTRDFPNFFIVHPLQAGASANFITALLEKATYISYIISRAKARGINTLEPTEEAEQKWVQTILETSAPSMAFLQECTPAYFTLEGMLTPERAKYGVYALGAPAFYKLMEDWRNADELEGLELDRSSKI